MWVFEAGAVNRSTEIMLDPDYPVEGRARVLVLRRPGEPSPRFDEKGRVRYRVRLARWCRLEPTMRRSSLLPAR
ncbi:hypothetical protein [Rubrobacter aplysinae]|uniref:hypothetical protein n=1 Tax=Rubrobacter aplysinae TaxID=909625 RepID=UPI00128CD154|nr:hypothetical protein [Rubrobacter aplysinae]